MSGGSSAVPDRPNDAVRVLHTSDWHLGVTVRGHPRDVDHDAVIAEILARGAEAAPDLILHTGDLFDGGRPAMREFGRAIQSLRDLAAIAPVVVLAGNHDSAAALEVLGVAVGDECPLQVEDESYDPHGQCDHRIRVHFKPTTPRKGAVATYQTRAGGRLRVAALPFVHANRVLADFDELLTANATYNDSLRKITALLTAECFQDFDPSRDVAVFASHLHVAGARTSSEKEIHISTDYATDPAHLDSGFGYLAFGHIHVPQAVAGGRGRYAGSILEVDFGEEGETKQVVIADLIPGRPTKITDIELASGRRLHRIRQPLSDLGSAASAIADGIVEVTVLPEPGGEVGGSAVNETDEDAEQQHDSEGESNVSGTPRAGHPLLAVDGMEFDTLTGAVRHLLPDAAVVSVIDARNPDVRVADDLEAPEVTESLSELFRAWLMEADDIFTKHGKGQAEPVRVAELFDEVHAAITTDQDLELPELEALSVLDPDLLA